MGGDDTFADVLEANAQYARGFSLAGLQPAAAKGLAVLTCIDSRIEPLAMLGLRPGDAKILRNAGARVTDDVVRSLVVSSYLLNVRRIMVVAHTNCRMTADDADVHRAIAEVGGPDTSSLEVLASSDQLGTLRGDVDRLRNEPLMNDVEVGGFVYDVDSGTLERVA